MDKKTLRPLCRGIRRELVWLDGYKCTFGDLADHYSATEGKISSVYNAWPSDEELADLKTEIRKYLLEDAVSKGRRRKITDRSYFYQIKFNSPLQPIDIIHAAEEEKALLLPGNLPLTPTATVGIVLNLFAASYAKKWMKAKLDYST